MSRICLYEPDKSEYTENSYRYINTISNETKAVFMYLLEVGYSKEKIPHRFENENLDSFFFAIILDGRATMIYKEHTFRLNAGSCILIDCLKPYVYYSDKNHLCEMLWLHFAGALASEYYKIFDSLYVNVICPDSINPFRGIIERIAEININSEPYAELMTSKLITDLFTNLITFRNCGYDVNIRTSSVMKSIKDYIDNNFADEIYLEILADKFGINKLNIARDFKRAFGINISRYILFKRISYSKHLLRFTDKSIEEISVMCGFYDASYFNKQFKAYEDITPLKYRKSWTLR